MKFQVISFVGSGTVTLTAVILLYFYKVSHSSALIFWMQIKSTAKWVKVCFYSFYMLLVDETFKYFYSCSYL